MQGPSETEWVNKIHYVHTMEYYSALKRKEILKHIIIWMNRNYMRLNEIRQSPKDKYYMIALI
jgi:hypothetical protein